MSNLSSVIVAGVAAVSLVYYLAVKGKRHRLPPGPKPHFLLGNLPDFPVYHGWLKYNEWRKQYGDIIYLNVMGQRIVVLNTLKASIELLDKRSSLYSSRTYSVMVNELTGWAYSVAFMPYSSRWRACRRLFHTYFQEKRIADYDVAKELGAQRFARNLLRNPTHFYDDIRLAFASIMVDMMYDIRVESHDHPYVKVAKVAMEGLVASTVPGNFLVDVIPALKYVPSWFPGAGFQKKANVWRNAAEQLRNMPADIVRERLANDKGSASIMASMFNTPEEVKKTYERDLNGESFDDMAKGVGAMAFVGGSDTTIAQLRALILALAKYPEVQKTARAEVDNVTGGNRLPNFQDLHSLPYLNAMITELYRWHTSVPLGIPHTTTQDDVYEGMFIPKGTAVIANIWAIHHDPAIYTNPEEFDPTRWLGPSAIKLEQDPSMTAFGFGRRFCPGRQFSPGSLLITAATVLACFDIAPPLDESGEPVELNVEVSGGAISTHLPFEVRITPRSQKAVQLLNETEL